MPVYKYGTMNIQRCRLIIIISVILLTGYIRTSAQSKVKAIDELMKTYHQLGQFNGSVLVAEKGKVIYEKGFGYANMQWKISNKADTKFLLASVSKQ